MLVGSKGKSIESNAKAPDFRDFHDCIWAGGVSLANDERKLKYAKVHMNRVLQNCACGAISGGIGSRLDGRESQNSEF